MVQGALNAHGIEQHIRSVLEKAAGTNGNRPSLISLPGGPAVKLNVPSGQELGLMALNASMVQLQTLRIILVALNDMDTRLRIQQAGTIKPPDTQGTAETGKVGDERGSQSPDVDSGIQESSPQGSKPSRTASKAEGNPLGKGSA
jgi:hypothetical protein